MNTITLWLLCILHVSVSQDLMLPLVTNLWLSRVLGRERQQIESASKDVSSKKLNSQETFTGFPGYSLICEINHLKRKLISNLYNPLQ